VSLTGTGGVEMRLDNEAVDITAYTRRFVWTESLIGGGFSWSLDFSTEEWDEFTDVLLGRDRPEVRFRLKTVEDDIEATTDWRRAITDGSTNAYRGTSLGASVWGSDKRLLMRQKARTRAWPATSLSDLVARIANEYGFAADVETTSGRRDRWQVREDDWTFLYRRARESSTGSARADSFLWLDEDVLRFGAPDTQAPSDRRHDFSEVENRIDRIVLSYAGRAVDRAGGATLSGVGFDLAKKATRLFTQDATKAGVQPALAKKVPRDPGEALRVVPVFEETPDLVEAATRARWGRSGPRYFTLRLDTRPDLTLRLGAVVEVQANVDARRQTPFLGRFVVLELQHVAVNSAITTTAVCFRREAYEGEEDPTGVAAAQGGTRDNYIAGQPSAPRTILVGEVLD